MDLRASTFALVAAGVTSLAGCSFVIDGDVASGIGAACAAATDCQGSNAVCDESKTCTLPCGAAEDCPSGSLCVASFCRAGGQGALGDACMYDTSCATAQCKDGLGVSPCSTAPDCPGGAVRVDGRGQAVARSRPSGWMRNGSLAKARATARRSANQDPPEAMLAIRFASAAVWKNAIPSSLVSQPSFASFT